MDEQQCQNCGRSPKPEVCTHKQLCNTCKEQHLTLLHNGPENPEESYYKGGFGQTKQTPQGEDEGCESLTSQWRKSPGDLLNTK